MSVHSGGPPSAQRQQLGKSRGKDTASHPTASTHILRTPSDVLYAKSSQHSLAFPYCKRTIRKPPPSSPLRIPYAYSVGFLFRLRWIPCQDRTRRGQFMMTWRGCGVQGHRPSTASGVAACLARNSNQGSVQPRNLHSTGSHAGRYDPRPPSMMSVLAEKKGSKCYARDQWHTDPSGVPDQITPGLAQYGIMRAWLLTGSGSNPGGQSDSNVSHVILRILGNQHTKPCVFPFSTLDAA